MIQQNGAKVRAREREERRGGSGSSSANRCSGFTNHATADTKSSHDLRRTTPHTNHLNGRPTAVTGPSHGPASQPTEVINNQRAVSSGGLPGRSTADLLLGGLTSLVNHQSAWGSTALCRAMEACMLGASSITNGRFTLAVLHHWTTGWLVQFSRSAFSVQQYWRHNPGENKQGTFFLLPAISASVPRQRTYWLTLLELQTKTIMRGMNQNVFTMIFYSMHRL